jgi:hypothetical protein
VRDGCGGVPARNPSGQNTRAVKTQTDPRFAHRNHLHRTVSGRHHDVGNRSANGGVPPAMLMAWTRLSVIAAALVLLLAGCASGASPAPSSPVPSPTPTPSLGIDHKTGATDLVLRYDQGGGFIAPWAIVTQAPIFSLYGDGTIVFRDISSMPPQVEDGLGRGTPYRTARLSEPQIQALLQQAINDGALGIARSQYTNDRVADAPTTVFTIHAGGLNKTVSAYGLGIDQQPSPDAAVLTALAKLAERLSQFNSTGFETQPYMPARYRAMLLEPQMVGAAGKPIAWPWPEIKPTEFALPGDPESGPFPRRVVTADDVAKLKLTQIEGGLMGIPVTAPDGKVYVLALRPLLPDETS